MNFAEPFVRAAKAILNRIGGPSVDVRRYEAAGLAGRWPRESQMVSPIGAQLNAAKTVSERAQFLAANSPYVAAIVANQVTAFVGDGPSLQHPNKQIVKAWNERFWSSCDVEGVSDLGHMIARVMRAVIVSGESFVQMKFDRDTGRLLLRLIPAEQIDRTRNEDLGGGAFIIAGVEVDSDGRHIAFWILPQAPDFPLGGATPISATRFLRDDVLHVYDPTSPGSVRGISWLAAILTRAIEVDTCEDAQLAQQKVAALFGVMITDPSRSVDLGDVTVEGDRASVSLEPGTTRVIPGDATATVIAPPQNDSGVPFAQHMVRSLGAGAQVPYELVSADLSQTSFSSARFGDRFFRRRTVQVQKTILEPQLLDPIFRRFVALEVLSGRLDVDLETLEAPKWLWPGFDSIDPLKDTNADVEAVAAGFASRAEIVAKRGRDISAVDSEIAADPRPAPTPKPQAPDSANVGDQNAQQ